MSRYFDTLSRLRRHRHQTVSRPDLHLAKEVIAGGGPAALDAATHDGLPFPELQLASRQAAYAALLDLLRATAKTSSIPAVVIAGVSGAEPVREVVAGVELQARRQGISLRCGRLDLESGTRLLQLSSGHPLRETSPSDSLDARGSFRFSGSQGSDSLSRWFDRAAAGSDLLLIEAPPLSSSVDAALLGQACEGLVLVAEVLVTDRFSLVEAIQRARMASCEILGLVLTGTRQWLPRWISRLMSLLGRS